IKTIHHQLSLRPVKVNRNIAAQDEVDTHRAGGSRRIFIGDEVQWSKRHHLANDRIQQESVVFTCKPTLLKPFRCLAPKRMRSIETFAGTLQIIPVYIRCQQAERPWINIGNAIAQSDSQRVGYFARSAPRTPESQDFLAGLTP